MTGDQNDGSMTGPLFERRPASAQDEERMRHLADDALAQAAARRQLLEQWLLPRNWPFRFKANAGMILLGVVPLLLATVLIAGHADSVINGDQARALQNQTAATAAVVGDVIGGDVIAMQAVATSSTVVKIAGEAQSQGAGTLPSLSPTQDEAVVCRGSRRQRYRLQPAGAGRACRTRRPGRAASHGRTAARRGAREAVGRGRADALAWLCRSCADRPSSAPWSESSIPRACCWR